jgi:hypothetical protein
VEVDGSDNMLIALLCLLPPPVKKCCHRNCPKIALATGEFCSIHEREISATTF